MSACVIAQFPWTAIRCFTESEPAGVIVCSDTRVTTSDRRRLLVICSKQEQIAHNMFVSYTSSNVAATMSALKGVIKRTNARLIGKALRQVHEQYGGLTELLVVVWRKDRIPKILEVMPPRYEPKPRAGVVGIGDRSVLKAFQENFFEQPRPDLLTPIPAEVLENAQRSLGITISPPRYTLMDAAVNVAGAFGEAIRLTDPFSVGLPIQVARISAGKVRWTGVSASADSKKWELITAMRKDVRIPRFCLRRISPDPGVYSAVQLFN